jgi:hypothetical protein
MEDKKHKLVGDEEICGEGQAWRGCRNSGAERFGARLAGGWTEWFETPCRCCGRIFQGDTFNGLEVRWMGDGERPDPPPPAFEAIVRDAEAYAESLYRETLDSNAPLTFSDIIARSHAYAEERFQAAVEAAEAARERANNTDAVLTDAPRASARIALTSDEVMVLRNALETHRSRLMDLANQTPHNQEARNAYHAAHEAAGELLSRLREVV